MKVLGIIFAIFGILFILLGFSIEPVLPSILMGAMFFGIGGIFFFNLDRDAMKHNYINDDSPSETFRKNKERMEEIRGLRKERLDRIEEIKQSRKDI